MLHHPLPEAIIKAKATPAIVGDIDDGHVCSFKVASNAVKRGKRVKFNDHVQKYEYEKFDYVECSRHRKKPSNASKETLRHGNSFEMTCSGFSTANWGLHVVVPWPR